MQEFTEVKVQLQMIKGALEILAAKADIANDDTDPDDIPDEDRLDKDWVQLESQEIPTDDDGNMVF
ncbi:MAG: hypothetical protein V3U02_10775 [Calditrichia bacterium]